MADACFNKDNVGYLVLILSPFTCLFLRSFYRVVVVAWKEKVRCLQMEDEDSTAQDVSFDHNDDIYFF
jgi:hypothetical protein